MALGTDPWSSDPLLRVRERILRTMILAAVLLGSVAYVPSLWLSLQSGPYGLVIGGADTLAYVFVIMLWRRPNLPYGMRAWALVAAFYGLAVLLLALAGGFGAGLLWLLAACVITAILFGFRTAVLSLGLTTLTLVAFGIWVCVAPPRWAALPGLSVLNWFVLTVNFIFLDAALTLSVAVVFRDLALSLAQMDGIREALDARSHALGQAQAELELERAHRGAAEARLRELAHRYAVETVAERPNEPLVVDATHRGSVLVVDDDALVARGHARVLERVGFEVVIATQVAVALDRLRDRPFDLLLTDLTMPDLDGFALAGRALALQPDLRVIVATGVLEANLHDRARAAGIEHLLRKPFPGHVLVDACSSAIHGLRPRSTGRPTS